MNREQRSAFLQAQAAACLTKAFGYFTRDMEDVKLGIPRTYEEKDFELLIEEFGLNWNDCLSYLRTPQDD